MLDYADAQSEYEMLDLPHNGVAPDMLGEVRPLLGVVGLDQGTRRAGCDRDPRGGRQVHGRHRPPERATPRRRARSELARHHAPSERLEGERAPVRANSTVAIEDVREIAPYVLRHRIIVSGDATVDTVLLDAMASVPTAVAPPVSPVS